MQAATKSPPSLLPDEKLFTTYTNWKRKAGSNSDNTSNYTLDEYLSKNH